MAELLTHIVNMIVVAIQLLFGRVSITTLAIGTSAVFCLQKNLYTSNQSQS